MTLVSLHRRSDRDPHPFAQTLVLANLKRNMTNFFLRKKIATGVRSYYHRQCWAGQALPRNWRLATYHPICAAVLGDGG
jgi:hypothetical protein